MLADETSYNFDLESKRIDNACNARDNCEEDSWGWIYWSNVIGALTRRLNRLANNLTDK